MSDPRKKFMCAKCHTIINDKNRIWGKDSLCQHCIELENLKKIEKHLTRSCSRPGTTPAAD